MRRSPLLAAVVVAAWIVFDRAPASAEFAVCNSTTHGTVRVAYATTWEDTEGTMHGQSQGWYEIAQGECKIIILTLDVSPYTIYIYASPKSDPTSRTWGGSDDYCLDPKASFLYQGDAIDAPCKKGSSYGMMQVTTGGASPFTWYLRD